jgi:hypothetical protein
MSLSFSFDGNHLVEDLLARLLDDAHKIALLHDRFGWPRLRLAGVVCGNKKSTTARTHNRARKENPVVSRKPIGGRIYRYILYIKINK